MTKRLLLALLIFGLPILGLGQKKKTKNPHYLYELEYAKVDGISLKLELLIPVQKTKERPELIVFFHGGLEGQVPKRIATYLG